MTNSAQSLVTACNILPFIAAICKKVERFQNFVSATLFFFLLQIHHLGNSAQVGAEVGGQVAVGPTVSSLCLWLS